MANLGFRHCALNVKDPERSRGFYENFFKMQLEWQPDPQNIYLSTQGQDNLALHQAQKSSSILDHLGFFVETPEEVDALHSKAIAQGIEILHPLKTHRDGARSFYLKDPDGIVIQVLYHPPVSQSCQSKKQS